MPQQSALVQALATLYANPVSPDFQYDADYQQDDDDDHYLKREPMPSQA
jgi:hypothetical protein